jgi:hypothetical protein
MGVAAIAPARAKWRAAVSGSFRKRSAIQPQWNSASMRRSFALAPWAAHTVAVAEDGGIGRHVGNELCRLAGLLGPAQELRAGEQIGRVGAQGGRHGIEHLGGVRRLGIDRNPRLHEGTEILAGVIGRAPGAVPVLLEQQALHAEAMIRLRERGGELGQHARFELAPEDVVAPRIADERGGIGLEPIGLEGEGEGELALGGDRPLARKEGAQDGRGLALGDEQLLGAPAQPARAGPVGIGTGEGGEPVEIDELAAESDRRPIEQRDRHRIGDAGAQAVAAGDVAATIGEHRVAQQGGRDLGRGAAQIGACDRERRRRRERGGRHRIGISHTRIGQHRRGRGGRLHGGTVLLGTPSGHEAGGTDEHAGAQSARQPPPPIGARPHRGPHHSLAPPEIQLPLGKQ